jgi:hypothetical protein
LSPLGSGFISGAGFHGEHVFRGFSGAPVAIRTMIEQPHFTFTFILGFLGAPGVIRTTLEIIPLREILLQRGILG